MNYVIGSGPAGVACAQGLLARGLPVTMLDAGIVLEESQDVRRKTLASLPPADWPDEIVDALRGPLQTDRSGVPLKRVFGSDFPFRAPLGAPPLEQQGTRALRSYARGGLSQAWGATFLPFTEEDTRDWPVTAADLAPHYRAVMAWTPLSARSDGLDALFPLHVEAPDFLSPSPQARHAMATLERHKDALRERGFVFGAARLAVRARDGAAGRGCVYCGLCLHGCPIGSIYSADQTLPDLSRHPLFTYRAGALVRKIIEAENSVRVEALDLATRQPFFEEGERVFLAAGVLSTAQILSLSLGLENETFAVKSSQSFLVPALLDKPVDGATEAPSHTLSQVYLSLRRPAVSRRLVQLQMYTYNDLLPEVLRASPAGVLFRLFPGLERRLLKRLVVLQGLLHSEDSDDLLLRSTAAGAGEPAFTLSAAPTDRSRGAVRRVLRHLFRARGPLGLTVLAPLAKVASPGQSFHIGGSWPMSAQGGPRHTDLLGRPAGLSRVHVVDASVLPAVPAPPLTFTVMANAHRIASHA